MGSYDSHGAGEFTIVLPAYKPLTFCLDGTTRRIKGVVRPLTALYPADAQFRERLYSWHPMHPVMLLGANFVLMEGIAVFESGPHSPLSKAGDKQGKVSQEYHSIFGWIN